MAIGNTNLMLLSIHYKIYQIMLMLLKLSFNGYDVKPRFGAL